ncbi:MAG TPA: hypothetical protein VFP35_00695 [Candidatus Saccharimonadales bacterium]|nr:hypothetical protein [Candidatus Saccharimonadales bacterium]
MKKFEGTTFPGLLESLHKRAGKLAKSGVAPDPELFAMLAEGIQGNLSEEEKSHLRAMIALQMELVTDTSGNAEQWRAIASLVSKEVVEVRKVSDFNRLREPLKLALRDILLLRPAQGRKIGG